MDHSEQIPYFRDLAVFLTAAGIVVPVFHRLRLSPVLGFLFVGMLIGPYGIARFADRLPWLRWISIGEIEGVRTLADFGIIFLLFMIGLELSLRRLWQMKRLVFGLGSAQVLLTALAIAGGALAFGSSGRAATLLGAGLALSSTAIVMQLLLETRRAALPAGRASFAVLLLQDLAVVPILFLVGLLAAGRDNGGGSGLLLDLAETLATAVVTIAAIVLAGRRLLGPLFRLAGAAKSPELFMALTLLVVIAMAAATGAAGLSMALGAFLAGLLLAESEYRHAVEVNIEPFKGLLLGLFFLSVGMGIDLRMAWQEAGWILAAVTGLFALKAAIAGGLGLAFGLGRATALEMALLLGQGGEFAFVVVGLGDRLGLLPADLSQFVLLVVSLSMLATPAVAAFARRLARRLEAHDAAGGEAATDEGLEGHVVICGFGRVGQTVARLLDAEALPWTAIDFDASNVSRQRRAGRPLHYGDASRADLLAHLGAGRATALVVTLDDPAAAERLVTAARRAWPQLPVYARARDRRHADHLRRLGATEVIAEAVEASLQLGGLALSGAGLADEDVMQRLERERAG